MSGFFSSGELRLHLRKVQDELRRAGLGSFYAVDGVDVRYLSGMETGRVLVTGREAVLWVKDIYAELYDAYYSMRGYPLEVRLYDKGDLRSYLRGLRSKSVGVSSPAHAVSLKEVSGRRVVTSDAMKSARSLKTAAELDYIRLSCRIARAGMRKAGEVVRAQVRELDAVAEVEAELRRRGSEKAAFGEGMLLASGRGSADIHAKPSFRRIRRGPVVVDLGATYGGYFSDMTRTLTVGRLMREESRVMELVELLRDETIDYIRPGMLASAVNKRVEDTLKSEGYKLHHLAGHGVGLEVHEAPSFSADNRVRLKPGMVFTVEPGVYLPGRFGVRFEDTVLLTSKGCRKLT